ncbi:pyridine nucleotide-disulfide oxidoreductase domain-containing protein 2-like [Octopus sinensis]|uniref:Pyridine nucleotide-disulfide oxidoreductase domain-containing protein 2 n=1 Tax=Octopus sinensis TaxID=2607531 RepID=A0A6P7TWN1_9MOLL|nr:pyridine nucleotide-disulfide oxidoreductase domain-containing protein 2-like [Octopus sinensis]
MMFNPRFLSFSWTRINYQVFAQHKLFKNPTRYYCKPKALQLKYDAVIIGAGHNGLITAAYLQKAGLKVCVLEKRHVIGGAAVTEEIIPGFKFSRASYLLSLLRPQIYKDLELKKYGLKIFLRNPSSYTPLLQPNSSNPKAKSLTLGRDGHLNKLQIAQFSQSDAEKFERYEEQLQRIVDSLDPLLDNPALHLPTFNERGIKKYIELWSSLNSFGKSIKQLKHDKTALLELMTAPASKVLNKWFESEPLKASLATDAVIGSMTSPHHSGSGYVLLHHVMGQLEGVKGAWGYVQGGMGSVSQAIANCATDQGADIFTNKPVSTILIENNRARGVVLEDGTEVIARAVLSNATPKVTFLDLLPKGTLSSDLTKEIEVIDYTSPVTKINVAVKELPNFTADPNTKKNTPMPHHQCTIHLNCEHTDLIHQAYLDAQNGYPSRKPVIEMVIPSSVDSTISPPGSHVVLLFTQYTPYTLKNGLFWDEEARKNYADIVFNDIENYAPGFKSSIIGYDLLAPPDLESTFGLTGGNIFHGSMSLDQLYSGRPTTSLCGNKSPVSGLYLCGSGAHPGGGVMGAAGKLAAEKLLKDLKKLK